MSLWRGIAMKYRMLYYGPRTSFKFCSFAIHLYQFQGSRLVLLLVSFPCDPKERFKHMMMHFGLSPHRILQPRKLGTLEQYEPWSPILKYPHRFIWLPVAGPMSDDSAFSPIIPLKFPAFSIRHFYLAIRNMGYFAVCAHDPFKGHACSPGPKFQVDVDFSFGWNCPDIQLRILLFVN